MNSSVLSLAGLVFAFIVVIAMATLRTKARQRSIRKALGLPLRMETSTAEAQAKQAVRVFEQTDHRLTTTAPRLSKEDRYKMAGAIVKEKGLLPRATARYKDGRSAR